MSDNPYRQQIPNREVFTLTFVRVIFKTIWLFFPSILFLLLTWAAFWQLSQGRDLVLRTLENKRIFATFIVAEVFWTYITWYTSRIIGKIKSAGLPDNPNKEEFFWGRMLIQMPRFLSFSCLTVIILAFFKLDAAKSLNWLFLIILLVSPFIYLGIYSFWSNKADKCDTFPDFKSKLKYLDSFRITTMGLLGVALVVIIFFQAFIFLMILLIAFQVGLVLLLVFRRKIIFVKQLAKKHDDKAQTNLLVKVKKFIFDEEDRFYTRIFIFVLVTGLIFYIITIVSVSFSVYIGAFPFILLAFGMLLILGNGVTLVSVIYRINIHIIAITIGFIIGLIFEPHFTEIPEKKNAANNFNNRQNITEYFKNWVDQRRSALDDSSSQQGYPVYFVLADGGASRSGYWAASVLANLDSQTNGKFSKHVFCLSGASGGSVGNAAYFNLLRAKQTDASVKNEDGVRIVQDYLETDFLTYTVARMLGPDVFRHILPLKFIGDRASALAHVMEKGSGDKSLLNNSMATCFSEIITQKNMPYTLPILCINTTRMQDGKPTVISNVDITDDRFNKRLDFLDLLTEKEDLKLSTAVVLGASFPYLSPAGRVDDSTGTKHYFVDGGYFDNSGSGVVSEMIGILVRDTLYKKYASKLKFYVLHVTNSPQGDAALGKVNPLVNDLAAPVKTLVGAYGTQTIVNDERLRNMMKLIYPGEEHYLKMNLYDTSIKQSYPMDWVISDAMLNAMNSRLYSTPEIDALAKVIGKQ
jgi:predicted acylesterase/phospholipase RssA